MTSQAPRYRRSRHVLMLVVMGGLCAILFAADSVTNSEIATSVLYVGVVLIGARFLSPSRLWWVALGCVAMTCISFCLTPHGNLKAGLINTGLSIAAILASAQMAVIMLRAMAAEHQARLQLLHLSRLNSLGEISASIAHEVKQPLAAITTSARACSNWLASPTPDYNRMGAALTRISADAARAANIVERVREMSRRAVPATTVIDTATLLSRSIEICHYELDRSDIELVTRLPPFQTQVAVDTVQIQQVFLNLILNAIEAIENRGRRDGCIEILVAPDGDERIQFSLADNGIGIPDADIRHIFEPFHTTRPRGIGMGLAISRSIIEAHGGAIHASGNAHGGATFTFTLPSRSET